MRPEEVLNEVKDSGLKRQGRWRFSNRSKMGDNQKSIPAVPNI